LSTDGPSWFQEKAEYKPPSGVSSGIWRDCWIIRAPGADGCSGRYVVAASAGNAMDSGFCSWDFYTKDVRAFQIEEGTISSEQFLVPYPITLYIEELLFIVFWPRKLGNGGIDPVDLL